MNTFKKIGAGLLATLTGLVSLTGCQDYDAPHLDAPVAQKQANTTILELKETFWQDETNYIWGTPQQETATPVAIPEREDGSHYIIKGTVISSDEAGNVFKSLIIQDETAALAISINSYNLYLNYRRGQEIILDVTGMYIGKYNGLLQLGAPMWYENGKAWEASFMAPETFTQHVELNGWPVVADIDTLEVNTFSELSTDLDGLMKWQSQLVRFNNVHFVNGGTATYSTYHSSGDNQSLMDSEGNSLIVRTSGYSNFWNEVLPTGNFDLVCIASYYGTTGWQLIMIDSNGVMNLGNPTVGPGTEENPLTVNEAINEINAGRTPFAWVTGYIVGTVAPEVVSVTSNDDVEWTDSPILGNTLVIGQTPETKDIANALVMELNPNSNLYKLGNLVDNPGVYGKQIWIKGTMDKYMDTYGITGNTGTAGTWRIDGVTDEDEIKDGNGTEESPYTPAQIIALNPQSTTEAVETGVWVSGYIVGYMPSTDTYLSNTVFSASGAGNTNIVIAPTPDCTDASKCVGIQLPTGDVRNKLNLQANPANLGAKVDLYGDVMKYCGGPGIKNTSKYKLGEVSGGGGGGETPTPGGGGTESNPYTCADVIGMNPSSTTDAVKSGVWIAGYIVGYMPSTNTYLSNAVFSANDAVTTNMVLAPTADCTDPNLCVAIQLPTGDVRSALNLSANPGNLGKAVKLYGDIMKYCGGPGLKNTSKYNIDGTGGGGNNNPGGGSGAGTEANPYNCAAILAMNPTSTTEAVASNVWVNGYIVGWAELTETFGYAVNDQTARFNADATMNTNILMSDSPSPSSYTQCIAVQLPTNSAVRAALNLKDNPDVYGKQVSLRGDVMKYSGIAGLKNTSAYNMDGTGGGNGGGTDTPAQPGEDGVYSVAAALSLINSNNIPSGKVQVRGIISSITEVSLQYGNATYVIKDQTSDASGLTIFRGYYLNGDKFTAENQIAVGATVVVEGELVLYGGTTPEMTTGNQIVSYTAPGGGNENPGGGNDEPENPPTGDYKGDFDSFNGGTPKSSYATYTNATGWEAINCAILSGSDDGKDSNPRFTFIGGSKTLAPTLNGNTDKPGSLVSPLLKGGIGTLTFSYGFAFAETQCSFTVNVKDASGNVVKTDTVNLTSINQKTPYAYSLDVNFAGDFVIEIVNNCKSATASNKDRVSIWNLTWTN